MVGFEGGLLVVGFGPPFEDDPDPGPPVGAGLLGGGGCSCAKVLNAHSPATAVGTNLKNNLRELS
jgi:hypothetical protein